MPPDLNSTRWQTQQVVGYFSVVVRVLVALSFIGGVDTDDAKEFQNNREYGLHVYEIT
jgi:hypothetical protein